MLAQLHGSSQACVQKPLGRRGKGGRAASGEPGSDSVSETVFPAHCQDAPLVGTLVSLFCLQKGFII